MRIVIITVLLLLRVYQASLYSPVANDYDLYGTKVAINDYLMVSVDNLNMVWYATPVVPNNTLVCSIYYNQTSCNFVYSVVVPSENISLFAYNCIGQQKQNIIGFFVSIQMCSFYLVNEQVVSNHSAQDNFIIDIDGSATGVYGFTDPFIFYYELSSPFTLTIWANTLGISPRAMDIGSNVDYAGMVGYCQSTSLLAYECGFSISLNRSLSCPRISSEFSMLNSTQFPYSDPRTNHRITQSTLYTGQTVLSISMNWRTRRVLIGIQSLNMVLLYSFDHPQQPISTRQNGAGFIGYGKSVAWLDDQGEKAAILVNSYISSTNQWISSSVHVYDLQSDGFSDTTQPILVYPNSQQVVYPWINPSFIRLVCSDAGHLAIFDILGNAAIMYSSPAGEYPDTNSYFYTSIAAPCNRGTYRNYTGIELCVPCPGGTYSSKCTSCTSQDSFCPFGAVEELSYSAFESIEQDQEYPESPESTVFDDLLMQNMFSFKTDSIRCVLVSPMTWTLLVIGLGIMIALGLKIHEVFSPDTHEMRDRTKQLLRKMDLIGEGEVSPLFTMIVCLLIAQNFRNTVLNC